MKRLKGLGVRVVMALLLIVLVSIVVLPVKADDEPVEKPFKIYIPLFVNPKIEGLEPPEFGKEFLVSEPTGGSVNGTDIVFANQNEGLATWQQEVRVCPEEQSFCEFVLQVFTTHFSTQTGLAEKLLLTESKVSVSKEQAETHEQKSLVVYRNSEVQASGTGLTAALETNGWAGNPSVAWNPTSGNYMVSFWSNGNEEGLPRIYAWEVSGNGKLGAANLRVGDNGENVYRQFYPAVAVTPDGHYLIVWEQDSEKEPGAFKVFGQWLSQKGQAIGGNFQISRGTYEQHPKLVYVAQRNAFLVVYMYPYMDYDGFHVEIRGQWILDGEIGESFAISETEDTLDKGVPSVAVSSQGEILVAWSADSKIYGRLVEGLGSTQVLAETKGQISNHPKVASFGKDGFFLTWEEFPPNGCADKSRVWGKILKIVKPKFFFEISPDKTLIVAGKPFQLSQNETHQRFPGIGTWDKTGLVIWEVDNGDGGLWGRFFW